MLSPTRIYPEALLFLIYINDFASVSSKLYYVIFADDTNVFISGNNLKKLIILFTLNLINYMPGCNQIN